MSYYALSNNYNDQDKQGYYNNIQYGETLYGNSGIFLLIIYNI